jgi:hypothetical protein
MAQEVVAGLLDHVVQAHKGRLIQRLLQGYDGFGNLFPVLARWSFALCGTNEAFRKNGLDEGKDLLTARLSS